MKKPNEKTKALFLISAAGAALLIVFLVVLYARGPLEVDVSLIAQQFTQLVVCAGVGLLAVLPLTGIIIASVKFVSWRVVHTAIRLAMNRLSERIARRNDALIYPWLQQFLFSVLIRNNDYLNLPLGKDASCLTPWGAASTYRKNCVFYQFRLITPERPEMDTPLLRMVIQNYIAAELNNYGIPGLASHYQHIKSGIMPSVFLDRVSYDEVRHHLVFDVLYVCTEPAARYVIDADCREAAPEQGEREVYDDELQ